jgi:NTE family protein
MKNVLHIILMFLLASAAAQAQDAPNIGKIGVALSGGAARGFAHLGALQALEENGIVPAYVAGVSMGAILGSIYASGMSPYDIYKFARKQHYFRIISLGRIAKDGFIKPAFIHKMLDECIGHCRFDMLQKKMFVGVTNFDLARSEIIDTGCLKTAVSASAAIPLVFEPVTINGYAYVDGGVMHNLPVEPLVQIEDCRYIIGISVVATPVGNERWRGLEHLSRTFDIMVKNTETEARKQCHFFLEIEEAASVGLSDFKQIDALYRMGYQAMNRYIAATPALKALGTK